MIPTVEVLYTALERMVPSLHAPRCFQFRAVAALSHFPLTPTAFCVRSFSDSGPSATPC